MRIQNLVCSLLLTAGLVAPVVHADCKPELRVARMFPWPAPTAELIQALKRYAEWPNNQPGLDGLLNVEAAPDQAIAWLFQPATIKDVRAFYGPNAQPPPAGHPLMEDLRRRREVLALAVSTMTDEAAREEWIGYLAFDYEARVRSVVVSSVLEHADQPVRDVMIDHGLKRMPSPDPAILSGGLGRAALLSAGVRWRLIRAAIPLYQDPDQSDEDIEKAIDIYPERAWLRGWLRDQRVAKMLADVLGGYQIEWRDRLINTLTGEATMHQYAVETAGFKLANLNGSELRQHWLAQFTESARNANPRGAFAREVLDYAKKLIEVQEPARRVASEWTLARLHAFERGLEPAN